MVRPELESFVSILEEKLQKEFPEGIPEESVDLAIKHLCDRVLRVIQDNSKQQDLMTSTLDAALCTLVLFEAYMRVCMKPAPTIARRSITKPDVPEAKKRSGEWKLELSRALGGDAQGTIPAKVKEKDNG